MSKVKFFLIAFIFFLVIVILNFRFMQMAGGDQGLFINPSIIWDHVIYAWDDNLTSLLGWVNLSFQIVLPFILFFKFLDFLPTIAVEYLYFVLIFCGILFSSYYFFNNYLFKNDRAISIISSLIYLLNVFFFVSYTNYNIHLSFIVLPLLFSLCNEIVEKHAKKTIVLILFISLLFPSVFTNPPAGIPLFLAACLYFIFLVLAENNLYKKSFILVFVALAIFILINLWWITTFLYFILFDANSESIKNFSSRLFQTTSLHEAFRFLGGWAFAKYYLGFKFFKFDHWYLKNTIFIFCNYIIIIAAYSSVYFRRSRKIFFFLLLSVLSLFFAKGDLEPWGKLYVSFFKFPGMYIFREPYTKFMLIYVFSLSSLVGFFLLYWKTKKRSNYLIFSAIITLALLINSYPFIIGGFIPTMGHFGPIRSYLVKVPDYLGEYKNYSKNSRMEYRALSTPRKSGAYLWESGFNIGDSVLKYFSKKPIISYGNSPQDFSEKSDNICSVSFSSLEKNNLSLARYLSLMNVRMIIQENSRDWRWNQETLSPSAMKAVFDNLEKEGILKKIKSIGYIDNSYFSKIATGVPEKMKGAKLPSDEDNEYLREFLKKELLNNYALVLYQLNNDYFLPRFYASKSALFSKRDTDTTDRLLSGDEYRIGTAIFYENENMGKPDALRKMEKNNSNIIPILEFKKINSTKYRIAVHGAKGIFPLVFSESFHRDWKIYLRKYQMSNLKSKNTDNYKIFEGNENDQASKGELADYIQKGHVTDLGDRKNIDFISKNFQGTIQNDNLSNGNIFETWFQIPLDEKNHLTANGYANSWVIDSDDLCKSGKNCIENPDGSYDFEIIVEFWPQRLFYIGITVSLLAFLGCLGYLGLEYWRQKEKVMKNG